jgi:O-antigen/teichoic acid export membrane protein
MISSCIDNVPAICEPFARQRPRRLTLRMNFLWTLAGNVIYAACQWGILIALAKLGTVEMVGEFALALAIASPIMICAGLSSLRIIQATDAGSEYRFGEYLSLRFVTTAAALLAIYGVVCFSGYDRHTSAIILTMGLAKGFENISDAFCGLFQQHERMDRTAISAIIRGLLSLAAVAIGIYISRKLLLGVACLAAAWALSLVFYDVRVGANLLQSISDPKAASLRRAGLRDVGRSYWRQHALLRLAWIALPVVTAAALVSFNANIPRYFIGHYLGTAELGIFAALAYPIAAGGMIFNALGQSAMPRLAREYAVGNYRAFYTLTLKLSCIAIVLVGAGTVVIRLWGGPILLLLYRPEYAGYQGVFFWLGLAIGLGHVAGLLGYSMNAVRHFRSQLVVGFAMTLVMALGCTFLVARKQLFGAAIAMAVAAAFQAVANVAVIAYALRNHGQQKDFD